MTYQLATRHEPLQCRCQVTVRERSALARFVAGLKTRPPIRRSVRETAPIWLGANLGLPPEVQLLASSFIRAEVSEPGPLQTAVLDKVAEGSLGLEAYLDLDENLEPFLAAKVPMNGDSIDRAQGIGPLRSRFPASGDGLAVLPFSTTPDSLELKDYRLSALLEEGVLKAHLGKGSPSISSIEQSESPDLMHRLLELRVDLKKIVSSDQDSPVRRLVDAIEKADFEKDVNQHPELATMLFPPVAEYKAFYSKYANDASLTAWFWLDASSDGTEVVLEFEVSPTLYHLYKARNYMHYGARRKLAGFK